MVTDAFAVLAQTNYIACYKTESGVYKGVSIRKRFTKSPFRVSDMGSFTDYPDELSAWQAAMRIYPELLTTCIESRELSYRALARRGEILLYEGPDELARKLDVQLARLLRLHTLAMQALEARVTSKSAPKPMRLSQAHSVSWYETRNTLSLPGSTEQLRFALRCLPSPVDENVCSAHFRVANATDDEIKQIQAGFEQFVPMALAEESVLVKDVFNGTDMV